jgi:hypothetical protein
MSRYFYFASFLAALLAAPLCLAQSTSSAAAQASTYGSITGRVEADDGPLSFASVTVFSAGARGRGNAPRTVIADAEGNFKLNGLRSIAWSLMANVPGYVPAPGPPGSENAPSPQFHQIGENVIIRMIKGGVIAGRVVNSAGEAVVAIRVEAQMVRDAIGRPVSSAPVGGDFQTDDRGVYRIYGLQSGAYVVAAGVSANGPAMFRARPYEGNAPIYHPASTRETAAEISVATGGETQNVEIQYRSEPGHIISGTIAGRAGAEAMQGFTSVTLTYSSTGAEFNRAFVINRGPRNAGGRDGGGFAFYGVPNGQYELIAHRESPDGEASASAPRSVSVNGKNVAGVELTMTPLASVTARVQIDAAGKCEASQRPALEAQVFSLRESDANSQKPNRFGPRPATANRTGEIVFRNLSAGHYRFAADLLDQGLYLRAITAPPAIAVKTPARTAAKSMSIDVGRSGLSIRSGERLTSVSLLLAEGAASIRGRVKANEGFILPTYLSVHLIPVEPDRAEDLLTYAETKTEEEGKFRLRNLRPGKYWVLPVPTAMTAERPLSWSSTDRLKLRKEAERVNQLLELSPCQQVVDYELPYRTVANPQ